MTLSHETPTAFDSASGLPDPVRRPDFYEGVPAKRAFAWLIDVTVVALLCLFALPFTLFLGLFFFPLMMLFVGFLYRWVTIGAKSATWGMRLTGIELREADGSRLSTESAFMHTLGYSVSIAVFPLQLVSIALMLLTDRKQGLTDHVLGTAAINRPL